MHQVDLPEALPGGSKFLHIGMPKTGTTALQTALWLARDELQAHGVRNVSRSVHEIETTQAAVAAPRRHQSERQRARREVAWQRLAADFRSSDARCTFWSSETLSQASGDRVAYLADNLGADSHIVLTLRPLAPLLVSQWQQWLRRGGTTSLEDWARSQFASVSPDGVVRSAPKARMSVLQRLSLPRVIEEFGQAFSEDRIVFVAGDPSDRLRNFRVFESLMGVPEILQPSARDNASLPYPEAEVLRRFNAAYAERGGDRTTWIRSMRDLAREDLRQFTSTATPHPISAPRWMAEQSNEHVARWVEAVRASGVTFVGDPRSLLVDPADWAEEVRAPTQVDVDSAGRLMDLAFKVAMDHGVREGAQRAQRAQPASPSAPGLEQHDARALLREVGRRARRRVGRR